MWDIRRIKRPLCVFAFTAIAVAGCGSENSSSPTDVETTVQDTVVAEDDGATTDVVDVAMTIEALCDPLDEVVNDWVDGDPERFHMDLFATDDPASLMCEWQGERDFREVRIVYHASPTAWDATAVSGGEPLEGVDADSLYDGKILSVHADNGWTVDVIAFEGDPPGYADVPDVLVPIANAALAATR